ncbi:hypothetical protein PSECIP111951_01017 [Pseudoalteromonas holothuriae]|uniref:Flagellar hook-length control protein-like C-terminal domain-containing protein n=1 Tax=Pseudoalteromonas holothuriae TaxID=2963714 RepID=A0ABM9GG65_9GAMM|nr:flagellar hook-length control protein FliK [Pseudoalteromonas sp. CIP111951]CAH9054345.1 hypothetical protein PSECIP111951_01017 [Pseudoalteromonas sp. CIP111951]
MLNITFNNTKTLANGTGSQDVFSTQSDNLADEPNSFLSTFKMLTDASDKETPDTSVSDTSTSDTSASDTSTSDTSTSDTSTSKELIVDSSDSASNVAKQALSTSTTENQNQLVEEPTEEVSDHKPVVAESTKQQVLPKAVDELIAQINAANQQKTDVVVHPIATSNEGEVSQADTIKIIDFLNSKKSTSTSHLEGESVSVVKDTDFNRVEEVDKMVGSETKVNELVDSDTKMSKEEIVTPLKLNAQIKNEAGEAAREGKDQLLQQTLQPSKAELAHKLEKVSSQIEHSKEVKEAGDQIKTPADTRSLNEDKQSIAALHTSQQGDVEQQSADTPSVRKQNELAKQIGEIVKQTGSHLPKESTSLASIKEYSVEQRLAQQLASLTPKERSALKQGLQQLTNEGRSTPLVEQALSQLKALEEKQVFTDKSLSNDANLAAASVLVAKNKPAAYNSTKVDKDTAKHEAKFGIKTEGNHGAEQNVSSKIKQDMSASISSLGQAMPTPQVEQLFKAIAAPLTNGSASQYTEFVNYMQQLDEAPKNIQTQQNHATAQKIQVDPQMLQAVNIARNDAAKILQEKVSMMLNLNNQEAEIRLDPRELGAMQIRIRTDAEQAQVNFIVQNQQAKDLLEQSMPKLKEMLAEQGIELGESNIEQGDGSQGEQELGSEQQGQSQSSSLEHGEDEKNSQSPTQQSLNDGSSIDYYA